MTDHPDSRDPLRSAFENFRRAPRDIVRKIEHSLDDLRRMADGTAQVTVTHYEVTEDEDGVPNGITRRSERVTITAPITNNGKGNR